MGEEEIFFGGAEEEELEEVGRPITKISENSRLIAKLSGAEGNYESAKVAKIFEVGFLQTPCANRVRLKLSPADSGILLGSLGD